MCPLLTDSSCKVLGFISLLLKTKSKTKQNLTYSRLATADLNLSPGKMNDRETIKERKEYNHSNSTLE